MKDKRIPDFRFQIPKFGKRLFAPVRSFTNKRFTVHDSQFTVHPLSHPKRCGVASRSRFTRGCLSFCLILLIAAITSGCASREKYYPSRGTAATGQTQTASGGFSGVYHTVKQGQTLWRISKTYGVDLETLQWVNDIEDVRDLRVGRVLFIPGVSKTIKMKAIQPEDEKPSIKGIALIWPLLGKMTSHFGPRGNSMHHGIDLAAPKGTPVKASAPGRVAYSGNGMRGYGKVVVLKHANDFSTVYAHNSVLQVRMGDNVRKGQTIAKVGATGRATGPHLHFEIRRRGVPEDPRKYLSRM